MRRKSETQIYLEQPGKLDIIIKNKLIERQQLRDIALSITANMDGERVQSSGSKSKLANAIDKFVDMEAEIDSLIDKYIGIKKEVIQTIEQLYSPIEYDILFKRYIQQMTLQEIADHYGRDYEWVKVNCQRACCHVQAIRKRES